MPVRAAMIGKAGKHQAQTVKQLGSRTKGTADARHTGALMQRQRSRNIQDLLHTGFGSLRHAAAGIGGERFQIAPGALGIQHAQGKGRLAGAGHACDAHDLSKRNVHINILQVVDLCSADQHFIDHIS